MRLSFIHYYTGTRSGTAPQAPPVFMLAAQLSPRRQRSTHHRGRELLAGGFITDRRQGGGWQSGDMHARLSAVICGAQGAIRYYLITTRGHQSDTATTLQRIAANGLLSAWCVWCAASWRYAVCIPVEPSRRSPALSGIYSSTQWYLRLRRPPSVFRPASAACS